MTSVSGASRFSVQDWPTSQHSWLPSLHQQHEDLRQREIHGSLGASKLEMHLAVNDDEYGVCAIQSKNSQEKVSF